MKNKKRSLACRFLCLVLLAVTLTVLAGCGLSPSPRANRVVAKAGNVEILYDELYYLAMNGIDQIKKDAGDTPLSDDEMREKLNTFVWEKLVTQETALLSIGYDYDINVLKGEISEQIDLQLADVIDRNFEGDMGAYADSLNEAYMTDRYVRLYIGIEDYLPTAIVKAMLENGELDDSDDTAMAAIKSDRFARTVHVFIDKSNKIYSAEENLAHAKKIAADLAAITDDAKRYEAMRNAIGGAYNNDFSDTTGAGYYFAVGEMNADYEKAAFALADYGTSGVVETDEGYYIIMRLPKDEAYIKENFESLKSKTYFVALNDKVDARLAELTPEKTRFGEGLDLLKLPTISANGGAAFYIVSIVLASAIALAAVVLVWRKAREKKLGKA